MGPWQSVQVLMGWTWRRYALRTCGFPAGSYGHVASRLAEEVGIPDAFTWRFELTATVAARRASGELSAEQEAILEIVRPSEPSSTMEWLARPRELLEPEDWRIASMSLPVRAMVFWGFKSWRSGTAEVWALGPYSRLATATDAVRADPWLRPWLSSNPHSVREPL